MLDVASNQINLAARMPNSYMKHAAKQTEAGLNKAAHAANTTDTAELSTVAKLMQKLKGTGTTANLDQVADGKTAVSIADIRKMLQENSSKLKEELAELCEKNGISLDKSFKIGIDESGQIVVSGDNTQKAQIQALLREDKDFSKLFKQTKGLSDFIGQYDQKAAAAA